MAFRHGNHGTLTNKGVIWKCPSCGHENAGALEAGCTNCKAGVDAVKAAPRAVEPANTDPQLAAYHTWRRRLAVDTVLDWDLVQTAWFAGVAWATGNREPLPPLLLAKAEDSQGGWTVELVSPIGVHDLPEPRVQQTILAALAFYRDNQLAYGAVPGQLDAAEVSQLIEKLTPQEVEA